MIAAKFGPFFETSSAMLVFVATCDISLVGGLRSV